MSASGRTLDRLGALVEGLFPPACVICGRSVVPTSPPVCRPCRDRLPMMAPPRCSRCGATAPGAAPEIGCGECRDWAEGTPRCRTACRMEGTAARLVRALKYTGWTALAPAMGEAMLAPARELCTRSTVLVPVPLAPARLRERGFNQAELLARALGSQLDRPIRPLLIRAGSGRSQARSSREDRRGNVAGAFRVGNEPDRNALAGVLLVDDVITTGATVAACAGAIREAGLECVGAVGFARTLPPLHGA